MAHVAGYLDCIAQLSHDPSTQCPDNRVYARLPDESHAPLPEPVYHLKREQLVFDPGNFCAEPPWEQTEPDDGFSRLTGPARIPLVGFLPFNGGRSRVWFLDATGRLREAVVPFQAITGAGDAPALAG